MPFRTFVAALAVAAAACAPQFRYTPTTSATATAKPADCSFDILSTRPSRPYDELGVLDLASGYQLHDAGRFRETIRPQACAAGADAVLADITNSGGYIRGTLIRYRAQ
jgi:hypothetical protein